MAHNSFAALNENQFSRRWAGNSAASVDPYISGFFHTHWVVLPLKLAENVSYVNSGNGLTDLAEIKNTLVGSCTSVTLPGGTMNKAAFVGLGGIKWAAPTNVDFSDTISMKFTEFSTLPLYHIFHGWFRMIRDYRAGTSRLIDGDYTRANYTGAVYFWTTKPDGKTIEYACLATGLFPQKDPADLFGGDITASDKVEIEMEFNCDYLWHETWVIDNCQDLSDTLYGQKEEIIEEYGEKDDTGGN